MRKPGASLTPEQWRLVENNRGLVFKAIEKHPRRDDPELFDAGYDALIRSARGFDPGLGFKFSTYAYRSICLGVSRDFNRNVKRQRWSRVLADSEASAGDGSILASVPDGSEPVPDMVSTMEDVASLRRFIALLPDRWQVILAHRFGIDGCHVMTLDELGVRLGITKERVRQLQNAAIESLRALMVS